MSLSFTTARSESKTEPFRLVYICNRGMQINEQKHGYHLHDSGVQKY